MTISRQSDAGTGARFALLSAFYAGVAYLGFSRCSSTPSVSSPALRCPAFRHPLPYRLVRHPMMAGFFPAFLTTPTMTGGHLLFALLSCGYILFGVRPEEHDLADTHPEYRAYIDYGAGDVVAVYAETFGYGIIDALREHGLAITRRR